VTAQCRVGDVERRTWRCHAGDGDDLPLAERDAAHTVAVNRQDAQHRVGRLDRLFEHEDLVQQQRRQASAEGGLPLDAIDRQQQLEIQRDLAEPALSGLGVEDDAADGHCPAARQIDRQFDGQVARVAAEAAALGGDTVKELRFEVNCHSSAWLG